LNENRSRLASAQARIDAFLPAFLAGDLDIASDWVTLADLALGHDDDLPAWWVVDLVPGLGERIDAVLPGGSLLRMPRSYVDGWGGYIRGGWFFLTIEGGPLDGQAVAIGEHYRGNWANGMPRRTLSACMVEPATHAAAKLPVNPSCG